MNRIIAFMHWCKNQPQKLMALCCAGVLTVFAVVIAATTAINMVGLKTGFYQQKSLNLHDFEHVGVELINDMAMVNATGDTQLIYTGNVRNIYIKCDFSVDPGEFVAFYSKADNYAFGRHKMVYARQEDGFYVFRFPLGTRQVRIDTGVEPSIQVNFDRINLNTSSFRDITDINTGYLFYIMVLPVLVFSILQTLADMTLGVLTGKKARHTAEK